MRPDFARAADLGVTTSAMAETLRIATVGDYDVSLPKVAAAYRDRIVAMPEMREWTAAAMAEPEDIEALEVEF